MWPIVSGFMGMELVYRLSLADRLAQPIFDLTLGPSWWHMHLSAKMDSSTKDPGGWWSPSSYWNRILTQVVSVGAWASMHSLIWRLINICGLRAPGSNSPQALFIIGTNIPTGLVYYRECTYTQMGINP